MIQYVVLHTTTLVQVFTRSIEHLSRFYTYEELPKDEKLSLHNGYLKLALAEIDRLGLSAELRGKVKSMQFEMLPEVSARPLVIARTLELLHGDLTTELAKRKFAYIPPPNDKYFEQDKLFGDEVDQNFPTIKKEIRDAGNCLAAGLNTASGFHLMRAAEVGLWEVCRDRQTPLAQSGKIEFTEWGVIIGELEDAVKAIQKWPNKPSKEDAHKFYNGVLVEIRAFNDGWRRHAAHVRPYQPPMQDDEAATLFGHVSRFFKILASRIGEGKYMPLQWP